MTSRLFAPAHQVVHDLWQERIEFGRDQLLTGRREMHLGNIEPTQRRLLVRVPDSIEAGYLWSII